MQHDVMGAIVVVARFNMYFEGDISHPWCTGEVH